MTNEELAKRYPTMKPPEPRPPERTDPQLVRQYPTMFGKAEREQAARELAPEIVPPPEVDANGADFAAFKRAAQAAGLDTASANRLLTEYVRVRTGGQR